MVFVFVDVSLGISQRELKVKYGQRAEYNFQKAYESHKENWKCCALICMCRILHFWISQRELKEVKASCPTTDPINESHKENWKREEPKMTGIFLKYESHKENWKHNCGEDLLLLVHRLWWISQRELKASSQENYKLLNSLVKESHKENWKWGRLPDFRASQIENLTKRIERKL